MADDGPERLAKVRDFWDEHARWNAHVAIYDTEEVRDPALRDEAFERAGREDARRLRWFVHPGSRVVDLGSGMGRVMRHLAPHCAEVLGVDISQEMIDLGVEHLAGVDNARLVKTDGASLPGIEDGSVDLLYSLLCLIHVDRRACWRYLAETSRVLAPGGMAFLQFQDLATDEGFEKFQGVVGRDYPLEFYTRGEIELLLARAGLEPLAWHGTAEYVFVTAIKGSAADYERELTENVRIESFERDGANATARVRSALDRPQPMRAELGLAAGAAPVLHADAAVVLEPGREHVLAFGVEGGDATISFDGAPCDSLGQVRANGTPGRAHAGLLPPGFLWNEDTLARFPGLVAGWALE